MTLVERALEAEAGSMVVTSVDLVVTDDWTTPALLEPLATLGTHASRVPVVLVHDHTGTPDAYTGHDRQQVAANRALRDAFVARYGATLLEGRGIQHFAVADAGLLRPGMVVVGNDSHAPTMSAFGVLALAGQPTTVAACMHTGQLALRVPQSVGVRLVGRLPPGVSVRDAARALLQRLRRAAPGGLATGRALEFSGPGLATLSLHQRALLANVAPEALALTALFARAPEPEVPTSDCHATLTLDLGAIEASVARSGDPTDVVPVAELGRTRVDRVFVGTCAGGTFDEIAAFAAALGDRAAVPTSVAPVSAEVERRLERAGVLERLRGAGVTLMPPGCGHCFGLGSARLRAGEVAVTTGNRNAVGRMGDPEARVHLASGRTAGEAARHGWLGCGAVPAPASRRRLTIVYPDRGNAIRLHGPVTTDDITPSAVPGVGTSSDRDPEVMRRLLFRHVDEGFHRRDLSRTVLVADDVFGAGSNRASAVRALRRAGVTAVIARRVAPLYAAGARDEGLPVIELDDDAFFAAVGPDTMVRCDFETGEVLAGDRRFAVTPSTGLERALLDTGGLLPYLRAGGTLSEHSS
jgi:homoaconitase/3-isopropylmalate dehydratase large subunit/3-isopropylmalate dehydratase small subunit